VRPRFGRRRYGTGLLQTSNSISKSGNQYSPDEAVHTKYGGERTAVIHSMGVVMMVTTESEAKK
jgi:hypothetical protein